MMKSRTLTYSKSSCELYSSMSAWLKPQSGNSVSSLVMPICTRWMLVDSIGSRKPPARPRATTLRFQAFLRLPVLNLIRRGSASGALSRLDSRVCVASSSLMCWLQ